MFNESQLQAILTAIQEKTSEDLQTPEQARAWLVTLTGWLAWSGEQVAITAKTYNIAKKDAYHQLRADELRNGRPFAPSLAKDYVGSLCSKEAYAYDLAERTNRTLTHTIDAVRSILSSQKAELSALPYSQ